MEKSPSTMTIVAALIVATIVLFFQYQGFSECEKNGGRMVFKMKNYYECVK